MVLVLSIARILFESPGQGRENKDANETSVTGKLKLTDA